MADVAQGHQRVTEFDEYACIPSGTYDALIADRDKWRDIARSRKDGVLLDTLMATEAELTGARNAVLAIGDTAASDAVKARAWDLVAPYVKLSQLPGPVDAQLTAILDGLDPEPVATYDAVIQERDRYRKALEQAIERTVEIQQSEGDREHLRDIASWSMSELNAALDPEAR